MPGLVPGIHVLGGSEKDVDGRVKPGHDSKKRVPCLNSAISALAARSLSG